MKKIYSLSLAMFVVAGTVTAQNIGHQPRKGKALISNVEKKIARHDNSSRTVNKTFTVDYEEADRVRQDAEFAFPYDDSDRYAWDMNMRYDTSSESFKYIVVDLFQSGTMINDSYGTADGSLYPNDISYTDGTFQLDSVYMNLGHLNTSGVDDTLEINIIALTAAGYPTSTILATKKLIGQEFVPGATSWLQGGVVGFEFNYMVPVGQKIGVQARFYGAPGDTLGAIAGFVETGAPCAAAPGAPVATASLYAPNSYTFWYDYAAYGLLPQASGGDIYYPCDANGDFDPGIDSDNYIQNWALWFVVTADVSLSSVAEANSLISKLEQNYPNPFSSNSTINYSLSSSSNVTFTITDLTGKEVMSENYGKQGVGQHIISVNANNLESGVYYYTLTAGSSKETRKMVVAK